MGQLQPSGQELGFNTPQGPMLATEGWEGERRRRANPTLKDKRQEN